LIVSPSVENAVKESDGNNLHEPDNANALKENEMTMIDENNGEEVE